MRVRVNNKIVLIVLLIIFMLLLVVGYAVFSEILTISGTANAKGTFDLEFQNAEVVKNVGANKENTKAEISADKNTLVVNVADLSYPGAGVEFSVDIVNEGTMPAEVGAVTPTNITGSDKIKVTGLEGIKVGHPKIEVGDICNIHFTVEWPTDVGEIPESESSISFGLQIEYTQSTGENETPIPEYTVPTGLTATYGQTLANVELPQGFRFQDELTTPVGNVGTNTFKVTYTSEDGIEVTDIEVSIEVGKATPTYTVPTGLTAVYGDTLASVILPQGFNFQDLLETSVGNVGTNNFKVTYTPVDTNNYKVEKDIEISIVVLAKEGKLTEIIKPEYYGKSINYVATVRNNETNTNQEVNNWKLLYKDENKIYIILDDFLPNNLVPADAGLNLRSTYFVNSKTSREALLNGLKTTSYWNEFSNGVAGAEAQGAPELELLKKSNNDKHNTEKLVITDTLYVSHSFPWYGVEGYWLATASSGDSDYVYTVRRYSY